MDVFEKEGTPTQDAVFREHLNKNWEAGNKRFAEIENRLSNTEKQYDEVFDDKESNEEDKKKKESRLKQAEDDIAKLKRAVFGDGAVPIMEDNKSIQNQSQNIAKEVKFD